MTNLENRLFEANLIRAVSTIGIVIFHTFTTLNRLWGYKSSMFHLYPVGNCGDVLVAVFFILSGFLLYINHSIIINVPSYSKNVS